MDGSEQTAGTNRKVLGVLGALGAVAIGWVAFAWHSVKTKTPVSPPATAATTAPQTTATPPAPSMPSVEDADATVRRAAGGVSSLAGFASWLEHTDLARRFVSTVDTIADGDSPRTNLAFMAPKSPFKVMHRHGRTYIDQKSFARFDQVADIIASIDAKAAADAWNELHPLLSAAYAEVAAPGTTLDGRLSEAVQRLTSTVVPASPVEVIQHGVTYEYADQSLQNLSAASKDLLRMGPRNERLIQTKLRELSAELHLSPVVATQVTGKHRAG